MVHPDYFIVWVSTESSDERSEKSSVDLRSFVPFGNFARAPSAKDSSDQPARLVGLRGVVCASGADATEIVDAVWASIDCFNRVLHSDPHWQRNASVHINLSQFRIR